MSERKPRKMPKNQRAYPKKGKPRLVEVGAGEIREMLLETANVIDTPHLTKSGDKFYAKADELRKWRDSRVTSFSEPTDG